MEIGLKHAGCRALCATFAAVLAGCAEVQSPVGGSAAMPQAPAIAVRAGGGASWMDAQAVKWDLLYVSNINGTVTVYRYGGAKVVGTLGGFSRPKGECVDRYGDVYVTDRVAQNVVEYQHGAASPTRILSDTGFQDFACSIDPTTGNLAVANSYRADGTAGGIAIYDRARGRPKHYRILHAPNPLTCAYDAFGNLLIASDYQHDGGDVVSLDYLPRGSETFIQVHSKVSGSQAYGVFNVQWDGKYWALLYNGDILRYEIAGDGSATYEGTVYPSGNQEDDARFWIANFTRSSRRVTQVVAAQLYDNRVSYWKYPAGGQSIGFVTKGLDEPFGVAVSPASH